MDEDIKAKAIIEMLGAPKEHIEQVLKDFVEKKLKSPSADFIIESTEYTEATEAGKLFSTFVEVIITCKSVNQLVEFVFDAMPSSLEVFQPSEMMWDLPTINGLLNDCAARIHQTDMIVKNHRSEIALLNKNSIDLLRNFVRYLVREKNDTLEKISDKIGIDTNELKPFIDRMIEDNQLAFSEDVYLIP